MRAEVERTGAANVLQPIGGKTLDMAAIRLMVWTIRGTSMGAPSSPTARGMDEAAALLSRLIERAVPSSSLEKFAQLRTDDRQCGGPVGSGSRSNVTA